MSEEQDFECPECGEEFEQENPLKTHIAYNHPESEHNPARNGLDSEKDNVEYYTTDSGRRMRKTKTNIIDEKWKDNTEQD